MCGPMWSQVGNWPEFMPFLTDRARFTINRVPFRDLACPSRWPPHPSPLQFSPAGLHAMRFHPTSGCPVLRRLRADFQQENAAVEQLPTGTIGGRYRIVGRINERFGVSRFSR